MPATLYRNGVIHSATDPFADAVLVADGQVAWLGSDDTVHTVLDGVDEVVDLDGALVAPAFVDSHVHLLQTGLAVGALDLSPAAGVTSLVSLLDRVAAAARTRRAQGGAPGPLLGRGWDEARWPERRPPTRQELDRATDGAPVHLARTDMHSAVVSSSFAEVAGVIGLPGWSDGGVLSGAAHHAALQVTVPRDSRHRETAWRTALQVAAARGVAAVHEHSIPPIDTREDLAAMIAATRDADSGLPLVSGYRAELCETTDDARAVLTAVPGLTGIGGDLCVDGSLGSRTASLRAPYADHGATGTEPYGRLLLTAEQVANHVAAVTRAGVQAGFHVIGDHAMEEVLLGIQAAADIEGVAAVRGAGHRIEHAEMVDAPALARMVLLGVTASVQPAFDALWGGPDGMYARRLGAGRAAGMNALADLATAGVPLAFGSDSPVTAIDPWAAVLAAISLHEVDQRISARAAFRAHTRGGWRAAGLVHTGAGEIRLGAPATLAVWHVDGLAVQAPDGRVSAWSTDPRAGTPLLPELGPERTAPVCLRTLREGRIIHDAMA